MSTKQNYRGNGNHDWESVVDREGTDGDVCRLRVPGGWLYNVINDTGIANTVFVPMPEVVKHKV